MIMRKLLLIFVLFTGIAGISHSQDYNSGIGIRGGPTSGLVFKHFTKSDMAWEGILHTRFGWTGVGITGLIEMHADAFGVDNLRWVYGAGAHIAHYETHRTHYYFEDIDDYTIIGVDGLIGMEYTIRDIPFAVSFDWKPVLNLVEVFGFWFDEFGLSVRYVW